MGTVDFLAVPDPECLSITLHYTVEEDCFHLIPWGSLCLPSCPSHQPGARSLTAPPFRTFASACLPEDTDGRSRELETLGNEAAIHCNPFCIHRNNAPSDGFRGLNAAFNVQSGTNYGSVWSSSRPLIVKCC